MLHKKYSLIEIHEYVCTDTLRGANIFFLNAKGGEGEVRVKGRKWEEPQQ